VTTPNGLSTPQIEDTDWRKSSYSGSSESQCVEIAGNLTTTHGAVGIRDSKNPQGTPLLFAPDPFASFIHGVRIGRFDL